VGGADTDDSSYPSLPSNEIYEAAPRRTTTKTIAMAKATSARPATNAKKPPLLGSRVPGLVVALAVGLEEAPAVRLGGPLVEPLAEALGEPLAEGLAGALAEPLGEPLGEALVPLTATVAVISGCILQWYAYVPGLSNANE
jgi:hypothetical protein